MNRDTILGLIRHLLTYGGGIVTAKGYADADDVSTIVGALVALAGAAWSIIEKRNRAGAAAAAKSNGGGTAALLMLCCIGAAGLLQTGCGTTGVYKVVASTELMVDKSMTVFAEYVVAAEKDPSVSQAELLKVQGRVKMAFDAYRTSMNLFYELRAQWAEAKAKGLTDGAAFSAAADAALDEARAAAKSLSALIVSVMGKD